jgi:nucleoside-diphosphate-sugar epimerase
MKVLVTGAGGFVGRALVGRITLQAEFDVTCVSQSRASDALGRLINVDITNPALDLAELLQGQQTVIHLAARAHVNKETVADPLSEYRRVNVEVVKRLAISAAEAGVSRFIFLSSIGVQGNANNKPFTESDPAAPEGDYARSKWEAEQTLWEVHRQYGLEVVIIRPPLIYGPGAPGNFATLVKWVEKGIPLPLGAIRNRRSFIALDNLIDLILTLIRHPAAANQVFLASDQEDVSTSGLLRSVATAMGKRSRVFPFPALILKAAAHLVGKQKQASALLGSLQVDSSKAFRLLGWTPPLSLDQGLRRCFQTEKKHDQGF